MTKTAASPKTRIPGHRVSLFPVAGHRVGDRLMRRGSGFARFVHAVDDEGAADHSRNQYFDQHGVRRIGPVPDRPVRWPW